MRFSYPINLKLLAVGSRVASECARDCLVFEIGVQAGEYAADDELKEIAL